MMNIYGTIMEIPPLSTLISRHAKSVFTDAQWTAGRADDRKTY